MSGIMLVNAALAAYCVFLLLLFGAAMGSFLNCAAWRTARGESFLRGRSRCPVCAHPLGPLDLVPVLSWVLSRGRCRYCGTRVSARYPLTECAFALLTAACLFRFGWSVLCLRNYVLLCCLFFLSLVDMEISEIPDGSLWIAAAAWLAALPFLWTGWGAALRAVLSGLVYGGALLALSLGMDRITKKESLGGGDIKLFAVAGLYLGFSATLFALLLSCILGLLTAAATGRGRGVPFPFGPSVAAAVTVMLLWGGPLVEWYFSLF